MSADRSQWPLWVRIGLWGLARRGSAWFFCWLSLALAAACVFYGFVDRRAFAGALLVFAAVWYYQALRWVDQHSSWE